jgi:hypothetical protein
MIIRIFSAAISLLLISILNLPAQSGLVYLVKPEFDYLDSYNEGLAVVKKGNLYGFIDKTGRIVIDFKFSNARSFNEGVSAAEIKNSGWGLIDKKGNFITPMYKYIYYYSGGFFRFETAEGKTGFLRPDGTIAINPEFEEAGSIVEGYTYIKKNGRYGYINSEGKIIIKPEFGSRKFTGTPDYFIKGKAVLSRDNKLFLASTDGSVKPLKGIEEASLHRDGYGVIKKDGKYCLTDMNLNIIGSRSFDSQLFDAGEKKILFMDGNKYGAMDLEGNIAVKPVSTNMFYFRQGYAKVIPCHDCGFTVINDKGEDMFGLQFTAMEDFRDGIAFAGNYVRGKARYFVLYIDGRVNEWTPPAKVHDWKYLDEGMFAVQVGNEKENARWMFVDKNADMYPSQLYDRIEGFNEGIAVVELNGKSGFVKNPLKLTDREKSIEDKGALVGKVKEIRGKEIIITGPSIGEKVFMGDTIHIYTATDILVLKSTFPMLSNVRCILTYGSMKDVRPGAKSYRIRR